MYLGGLLVGLAGWLGWMFLAEEVAQNPITEESEFQADSSVSKGSSSIATLTEALHSAKAKRDARIALDPDAYWDPERSDRDYRSKVLRHNQISQFLTSSRRDDQAYREVMIKLLENGYDLSEWVDFVGIASQYHMPVSLARRRLEAEGFLADEIERVLVPARAHQSALRRHVIATSRMVMGITNESLIHELLEIELPYAPGDQVLGVGPLAMIRGDRLHTESDWMDEEFSAAAERYSGPKRSERDMSQPAMLKQENIEGVLIQTEFEMP
ncbi:hypothetical protein N8766_00715 [bacterium]|nr:hypothetical protein [Verrucomicrobiota bacterium]MDA7632605.1 hypothetical protein [bacterium]